MEFSPSKPEPSSKSGQRTIAPFVSAKRASGDNFFAPVLTRGRANEFEPSKMDVCADEGACSLRKVW